ncbi:MAG: hypothetical protein IBX47_11675 [Desulfuromonadales bacterium]|nr:hypothetical protein [Desulfuromonadales bacterium]
MKNTINNSLFVLTPLLFIALLFTATPAWSADKLAGEIPYRFGNREIPERAIEKTGFFKGVVDGLVRLQDEVTYRTASYLAAPGMIVTKQGVEIDPAQINPSSIVKLIIVDAEVVEIILLRESS